MRPRGSAAPRIGRLLSVASLIALAAASSHARAAEDAPTDGGDSKIAYIVKTDHPPVIDGLLDDEAWSNATVIDDFHQVTPVEYAAPTQKTRVLLTYGPNALYVGVRLFDTEPDKINSMILRQGEGIGPDDRFWVLLDSFNNRRSGYIFGINPNGVRFDGLFQNVTERQFDWDGIWDGAAHIDDQGWTIEYAIPFKTLSFDPNNDTWRMNFQRTVARNNETSAWASRNRRTDPSIMGQVKGFTGLEQGMGLDVVPSMSLGRSKDFSVSGAGTQSDSKPSLDVFYKVTPALNASLTLNTDFSATEVDSRQVNLTRFSLFYPEKRGFFLQDLDIFQFGRIGGSDAGRTLLVNQATSRPSRENGRPFFSRRLGLNADGNQVDLNYGAKLSGRIGQRWELGALAVQQDGFGSVDKTDALVARLAANVLGESSVGIIATQGDPGSNLDNSLLGADFRYLNSRLPGGRSVEGEAWYQNTDTEGLHGDSSAMGVGVRMPNTTGLRGGISVKEIGQNFNPALGYVNRTGIRDGSAEFSYLYRPRSDWLRFISTGVDVDRIDYLDGGVQSHVVSLRALELGTHERDQLKLRFIRDQEGLRDPFEISDGVVIPAGLYEFDQYYLEADAGPQRRVSGKLVYQAGDFYDGNSMALNGTLSWRPSKHFRSNLELEYNDVNLPEGDFIVRVARVELDTVFSNTLSWVNLIQYDNVSEVIGINSRLHWIPQAGREAYIVLNHNLTDLNRDNHFVSTYGDLTLKLAYTWRF